MIRPAASLRLVAACSTLALTLLGTALPAHAGIALTDLDGRQLVLEEPARHILIADGRILLALALLHPEPGSLLAAWPHDVDHIGPDAYDQFVGQTPSIAALPKVAVSSSPQSVERIVAAKPDLAIFPQHGQLTPEQRDSIEAAGIPVMTVDFFVHPLANLAPSLRLLARAIGSEARAEAFITFRQTHMDAIRAKLGTSGRPRVYLEPHAGISEECCASPGAGNIGDYVAFAGGDNIGAAVIPTAVGKLSFEYVLTRAPEVYVATGGPYLARKGGMVLGPGYTVQTAREALARMVARPGYDKIPAVATGKAYGLSHQLLNSPLDVLALDILAHAIHPDLFPAGVIDATVQAINRDFLAIRLNGVYWVSLTGE